VGRGVLIDMHRPRTRILGGLLALAVAALVVSGPSLGARSAPVTAAKQVKNLWSTINICDTERHPDQLGIRARMPGNGKEQHMWMRFFAQYMKNGAWVPVKEGGRSKWRRAGLAIYKYQELGWTFEFNKLAPGEGYTMRGLVKFEWRKHGKVLRHKHAYTTAHHPTGTGDPPKYSEATCFMSGQTL
jgi:hypothetical protein